MAVALRAARTDIITNGATLSKAFGHACEALDLCSDQ
jgi:hypothetical protein